MSGPATTKTILNTFIKKQYEAFLLNDELTLRLPSVSKAPGVDVSRRADIYRKKICPRGTALNKPHIKFITKNGDYHSMVWQTTAAQLKKAVRWGVTKPHSITGKVIANLGKSRATAYSHITKGMIGNSFKVKIQLIDFFQDRFEALQNLESFANRNNSFEDYKREFEIYIQKLMEMQENLDSIFAKLQGQAGLDAKTIRQLKQDLQADMLRAQGFLDSLEGNDSLRKENRSRGYDSIMEFVKQQMIIGLYELQGINQDNTFSTDRDLAFTRGELNDNIEDALKQINDHQPDLRNAVTQKHHGQYADDNQTVCYDFSEDNLSPKEERKIQQAISFIEGWDTLNGNKVSNASGTEDLDVFSATRWKTHRNLKASLKSTGYYLLNIMKGIFIETKPWEEETWSNPNFHLVAKELRENAIPVEPLWRKPFNLIKQLGYLFADLYNGIRDFSYKLIIVMPEDLINDWEATKSPGSLQQTLSEATNEIAEINKLENERLKKVLDEWGYDETKAPAPRHDRQLASIDYALDSNEYDDPLNALTRGIIDVAGVFTHNIYAKDPVGGLVYTAAYAIGAGAIFAPSATASIFGTAYVNWFSTVAYKMGTSKIAAALSGASTQAQIFATGVDGVFHGASGIAVNTLYQFGEDPLTLSAYVASAYGIGYLLVNGIAGHGIPFISDFLKEDLGSAPETGYPLIGAKVALLIYEGLVSPKIDEFASPEHSAAFKKLADHFESLDEVTKLELRRNAFALWLSQNSKELNKLNSKQRYAISRQIDALFTQKEQRASLKALLYPEQPSSIAFQLVAIPLAYIPAVLRLVFSALITLYALGKNQENPYAPIINASVDLWNKIKKDVSRLITVVTNILYLPFLLVTAILKATAYVITMIIGRVAALFDAKPGHAMYKGFAAIHLFFRNIGELLYPVRALKDVTVAHPTHTINAIETSYNAQNPAPEEHNEIQDQEPAMQSSYTKLQLVMVKSNGEEAKPKPDEPITMPFPLTEPSKTTAVDTTEPKEKPEPHA